MPIFGAPPQTPGCCDFCHGTQESGHLPSCPADPKINAHLREKFGAMAALADTLAPRDRIREWLAAPPPDERLFRSPRRWADLPREERDDG